MLVHPFKNNHGLALIFIVLFFTAAAAATVMFISLAVKIKGIQKEETTQERLGEIRTALQNYYLIHYDLPDPSLTTPPFSVPTVLLNLPQKYRFDRNGQMIRYDRLPAGVRMTTIRNIQVHGTAPENLVAAVLVAAGPDKSIDPTNLASPYNDPASPASDDIVLAVSLEAEALKIANHTVAVLQQAAKAYDSQFCDPSAPDPQDPTSLCTAINNDADTLFLPPVDTLDGPLPAPYWTPGTEWFDYTPPVQDANVFTFVGANNGDWIPAGNCYTQVGAGLGSYTRGPGSLTWYPNYAGQPRYRACASGNTYIDGVVPLNDEDITPRPITAANPVPPVTDADMLPLERPVPLIDEGDIVGGGYDNYIPATGSGPGCIHFGVLTNDPSRGTASLDDCRDPITSLPRDPGLDLAVAYGLNLVKLGYDAGSNSLLDPWGNQYLWGSAQLYGGLAASSTAAQDQVRDFHYWTFYSTGPDGTADTADDILPPADRIPGYFVTPQLATPIP